MQRPLIPLGLGALGLIVATQSAWGHLFRGSDGLALAAVALALALPGLLLARVLRVFLGHGPVRELGAGALAALLVYVPFWYWNQRGPIDVVLLHIDSLRAQNCSVYGYERETTPRLQEFAERDDVVRFTAFFSQAAGTSRSTPAMLAGIHPSSFYDPWSDGLNFLVPDRFPLLGQRLRGAGYRSIGLTSNPEVSDARNYGRGFDDWHEVWRGSPRPAALVETIIGHLEAEPGPLFYFGLILDPHLPYHPPGDFDRYSAEDAPAPKEIQRRLLSGEDPARLARHAIDDYDGEILEADAALGTLIDWLRTSGRLERTMLIVTSDHGEKFYEKGEVGHGGTLFEEVIDIPMLWSFPSPLRFPRLAPARADFDGLACHVDIVPTVLGYLGYGLHDPACRGSDLISSLFGDAPPEERELLLEELHVEVQHRALRTRRWKAMTRTTANGTEPPVLFELTADGERGVDLDAEPGARERLARMVAEIERRAAGHEALYESKADMGSEDAETLQLIGELGYGRDGGE